MNNFDNIVNRINSLKDKIINLKEIAIISLQDENEKLRRRCEQLEKQCSKNESDHNALSQYGRLNKVDFSEIPELVSEDVLEESVISVLADINVFVESEDIEACHWFGDKSQKTIVSFVNRKNCKKVLFNKKKRSSIDCSKHNFIQNTKTFGNENLTPMTPMNESIAYNYRKLKYSGLIYGCFLREGIVRIKRRERDRPVKIFHMNKLHELFLDFDFGDADNEDDIFLDASQVVNNSVQSSY